VKTQASRAALPLLAFVVPLAIYLALPAATVNGDGLRYWKLVLEATWSSMFLPGHLLYCPLQTLIVDVGTRLLPQVSAVEWMRWLSQMSVAGAVCLVAVTAKRLGLNLYGQALPAFGVAFSYGVWIQAIDIESYGVALFWVTASIAAMASYYQRRTVATVVALGAFNSLAALFHLAAITLVPASLLLVVLTNAGDRRRTMRHVCALCVVIFACFAAPIAAIGFGVLQIDSLGALARWLQGSDHGYHPGFGVASVPRALYGVARNILYLEFFWTASKWLLALKGAFLLLAGAWFLMQARRVPGGLASSSKVVLGSVLVFVVLQAALGAYYFGSDTERWVFLTPWIWLVVASVSSAWPARAQVVVVAVAIVIGAVNLRQGIWPVATDRSIEARIDALSPLLGERSLIISPGGDDWLTWYDLYRPAGAPPEFIRLSELVERHGPNRAALFESLALRIGTAQREGRRVLLIGVRDEKTNVRAAPWEYLESLGYPLTGFRTWFDRYSWDVLQLSDVSQTRVDRLR